MFGEMSVARSLPCIPNSLSQTKARIANQKVVNHGIAQKIRLLGTAFYPLERAVSSFKRLTETWRYDRIVKLNSLPIYKMSSLQKLAKDLVFIDLFRTVQSNNAWLAVPIYPVGGAVNYGLLYILSRALLEYQFNDVIEFGVGQTTKVLSAYANFLGKRVISIEHDINWVKAVSSSTVAESHEILYAPMKKFRHKKFGEYSWYELPANSDLLKETRFDLFLIDGPPGTKRRSRIGIVEKFPEMCAKEWLIIWDDLDRSGDLETFVIFTESLKETDIDFDYAFCTSMKTVGIIYTKKFQTIRYYF